MRHPTDPISHQAIIAALAIANNMRGELNRALEAARNWFDFYQTAVGVVLAHESMSQDVIRDSTLAGFLAATTPMMQRLPIAKVFDPKPETDAEVSAIIRPILRPRVDPGPTPAAATGPIVTPPPSGRPSGPAAPAPEPVIRFPIIEKAARNLAERNVMTRTDFDRLDAEARQRAFTVARVNSLETLQQIRDKLAKQVAEGGAGGTLHAFKRDMQPVIQEAGPALSKAHIENVYRTNIASAYSSGQKAVIDAPVIRSLFPYVLWTATHDNRTRADHLAMETAGIDGTAIFRADDPLLRKVWPPAGYNCRCHVIMLTLRDAARRGLKEAIAWLETGKPPAMPSWVQSVPIKLPRNWSAGGQTIAV
jgi:SPP1 gp7 family putative phage head morphogenesis protein